MNEWKRAIVRVFHHPPAKERIYRGTAFFIAPDCLLTARHVIEGLEIKKIFLLGDTGAWEGGGIRGLRETQPHPDIDVALLFLDKPVNGAHILQPAKGKKAYLSQEDWVNLSGFTRGDIGLETFKLQVSAYDGQFRHEVVHTPIGKGMSGGPVLCEGDLVGITRAKDDAHTYVIPLHAFWTFIEPVIGADIAHLTLQPVQVSEVGELTMILQSIRISDNDSFEYFRKTAPDSRPPDFEEGEGFRSCIAFLAQKEHATPDKAPLLEFLEHCKPAIKKQVTQVTLKRLTDWESKVANRLALDLKTVQSRVQQAVPDMSTDLVGVLLKIEPKNLVSEERFTMTTWIYRDHEFTPQEVPEQAGGNAQAGFTRADLERLVPAVLTHALRRLGGAAQKAIVEVIAPFGLHDWNVNRLLIQAGPLQQPLGKLYPLAFRSWDRLYHNDYDSVRHQWVDRWQGRPLRLGANQVCAVLDTDMPCQTFYDQLTSNLCLLLVLFSFSRTTAVDFCREMIGTALAAGLPFAFWPLQPCAEKMLQQIPAKLSEYNIADWPATLKHWRVSSDSSWHDVQMLWDNPENLPPDIDYLLEMYD